MLKDGQKDIITIRSNGNKQTYHVAARICSSNSNSGSRCGLQSHGSFPDNCAQSVVPARIKYFFRQLLEELNNSPIKNIPERVSLLGNWRCSTWDLFLRTCSPNHLLPSS